MQARGRIPHLSAALTTVALLVLAFAPSADAAKRKDRTAPTVPPKVAAKVTSSSSIKLTWGASKDTGGKVKSYLVYSDGMLVATRPASQRSFVDGELDPGTRYTYVVRARDTSGNLSKPSKVVKARTRDEAPVDRTPTTNPPSTTPPPPVVTPPGRDTTAPSAPSGVTATALSGTSVRVTWLAATDDTGVASYILYRNDVVISRPGSAVREHLDTTARPGLRYTYWLRAVDGANNSSAVSASASVTTPAPPPPEDEGDPGGGGPTGEVGRKDYVSLGDSFSSGMGSEATPSGASTVIAPGMYDGSACQRTSNSASRYMAVLLDLDRTDVSCAGATTDTLLTTGQHSEGPQISAVTSDAELVTLTIGGNDVQLLTMLQCVAAGECTAASPTAVTVDSLLDVVQPKLDAVLDEITTRAPDAQVRIAGYPYLLPTDIADVGLCAGSLSAGEITLMRELQDRMNDAIETAATGAGANVEYIDPNAVGSPFLKTGGEARDGCSASGTRWINGMSDAAANPAMWHPNALGYQYYASLYIPTISL